MTKKELIKVMEGMDEDKVITMYFGEGWSNIEVVLEADCGIEIHADTNPVFSDRD